jgi:hypothetical protein
MEERVSYSMARYYRQATSAELGRDPMCHTACPCPSNQVHLLASQRVHQPQQRHQRLPKRRLLGSEPYN